MKVRDIIAEYRIGGRKYSDDFIRSLGAYVWYGNHSMATDIRRWFDAEMPTLPESMTVYRGMSARSPQALADESNFLENDHVRFGNFLSCSTNWKFARTAAATNAGQYRHMVVAMLEIRTLAGARGIVVDDFHGAGEEPYKVRSHEDEIILHRDAEFQVTSREQKETRWNMPEGAAYWWIKMEQTK